MARSKQVSGVRETRTLRSKRRELESGDGFSYAGTKLETADTAKEDPARTAPALDPTTRTPDSSSGSSARARG
jgi:hypothetical protein